MKKYKEDLTMMRIYNIFRQVSSAMKYIHSLNYIHRDLSSSNILIMNDWDAKIAGF